MRLDCDFAKRKSGSVGKCYRRTDRDRSTGEIADFGNLTKKNRSIEETPVVWDFPRDRLNKISAFKYHMHLILYTKTGCHLCEGLQAKIEQITALDIQLELREIATNPDWWEKYQYEIPVLHWQDGDRLVEIPRISPRSSVERVEELLRQLAG
jgi:hypothetical protein